MVATRRSRKTTGPPDPDQAQSEPGVLSEQSELPEEVEPQEEEDTTETNGSLEQTEVKIEQMTETNIMTEENTEQVVNAEVTEENVKQEETGADEVTEGQQESADPTTEEQTAASDIDLSKYADNAAFGRLTTQGFEPKLAVELVELFEKGTMTEEDVDERAVEMLRALRAEHGCFVIQQVRDASLVGVQNKASYLMAVMRNFRDRLRQMGPQAATAQPLITGPDPESIKAVLDRTGYPLEVTVGQRKYGGPPPDWEGPAPAGSGHEIYVGHIPKDMYEDSLIGIFEEPGRIWDLRLMMDPMTGHNRGYGFVTYCDKVTAKEAAKKYDGFEIKKGKTLRVNVSVANTRLFLGNIPKSKTKDEILRELKSCSEGIVDVIVYMNPDSTNQRRNRGFCFVDFDDHKNASDAKRKLAAGRVRPWNCDLVVDWAEAQDEPDDDTMSKVKVLYVRNLKEEITEEELKEAFEPHGEVERVKKVKDYAFVHYAERESALKSLEALNGHEFSGLACEISLAKPQVEKQKRDRLRVDRERRQFGPGRGGGMRSARGGYDDYGYGPPRRAGRGGPRGARGGGTYGSPYPPPPPRGYGPAPPSYYGYGGGYEDYYGGGYAGYEDPYYGYGPQAGGYGYEDYGYGYDHYGYTNPPSYAAPARGSRGVAAGYGGGRSGSRGGGSRGVGRAGMGLAGGRGGRGQGGKPPFRGGQKRTAEDDGSGAPALKRPTFSQEGPAQRSAGGAGNSEQDFAADDNMSYF